MSYLPNLTYYLDRLSGFSTNIFRIEAQNNDSATANKILRFTLPSNALLNMRSFALHFNATTAGTGSRLPAKIDTLIERVEATAGGVQLSQGLNYYNVLRHAKDALMGNKCDAVCGHPEIVRNISYVDRVSITGTNPEVYPDTNTSCQFMIDYWEGFIGSCEPKILDASILSDLVVSIYLSFNNVLTSSKGIALSGTGANNIDDSPASPAASYTLNNVHATIEAVGLADAVYDNMVASMIAQKGYLEIPFKQYFSFNDTHSGVTRFTVATQSLDRLWAAFRVTSYDNLAAPQHVSGYKVSGAFVSEASGGAVTQDMGKPEYDIGGILDTNKENYLGNYYNFVQPASSSKNTYQWQPNGVYYPQLSATAEEMYGIAKNSTLGYHLEKDKSLDQYLKHYFVMCARLNMPDSEFSRTISGLDTRSVSMNGYFNTNNVKW